MKCVSDAFVESRINSDKSLHRDAVGERIESPIFENVSSAEPYLQARQISCAKKHQGFGPFIVPLGRSGRGDATQAEAIEYWNYFRRRWLTWEFKESCLNYETYKKVIGYSDHDEDDIRGFHCEYIRTDHKPVPQGTRVPLVDTISHKDKLIGIPSSNGGPNTFTTHTTDYDPGFGAPYGGEGFFGDCSTSYITGPSATRYTNTGNFPYHPVLSLDAVGRQPSPGTGPGRDFDPDPSWSISATQRKTIFGYTIGSLIGNGHRDEFLTEENQLSDTLQLAIDTAQAVRLTSVEWGRRKEFVFNEFLPDFTDLPYATPIGPDGQPLPLDGKPRLISNTDQLVAGRSSWHLKSFPLVVAEIGQIRTCSPYIFVEVPWDANLNPDYTKAKQVGPSGDGDVNVPIDVPFPELTLPPPYQNAPPYQDSWSPYMGKFTMAVLDLSFEQWKKSVGV